MVLEGMLSEEQIAEQKVINEEYKVWKKNAPALYSTVYTYAIAISNPDCQYTHVALVEP
jgi:histone-binding protein RBBP4